jgi:hypothetical protein
MELEQRCGVRLGMTNKSPFMQNPMQVGAESIANESINQISKQQFSTERSLERHETFGQMDGLRSSRIASLEGGLQLDY